MPKNRRVAVFTVLLTITAAASAQTAPRTFAELAAQAAAARDGKDPAAAIVLYQQALGLNPNWVEGWWMTGSLQYDSGLYREGADSLSHLVKLSPRAGPAWALLGLCGYETGDYAAAFEQIGQSLALGVGDQPQMVLVLKFHQAALLTKMGRFDEAMRRYAGFLPSQVTDDQVLIGLSLAHLRVAATPGEVPAARKDFYRAVGRGLAALLTGDHTGAKTAYDELLTRYPNDAGAHFAYGYFLFGSDAERAIQEWQRTLSLDRENAGAHGMLAWAFWLREQKDLALEHAERAIRKDPGFTIARVVLGRLTVAGGRTVAGIEQLERSIQEDPANLEAHLALVTAYSGAGLKTEAQRERQLCMRLQAEAGTSAQP